MATTAPIRAGTDHARELRAVFVSHSSADKAMAQSLCASLEAQGFTCWIAPRDIAPGQSYALGCLQGVAESHSFVLLASESALASVQVLSEVEQAHKRAKPIYTVLLPPAKVRGEMDFYLSRLHWMDGGGRSADDIAAKLAQVLGKSRDWDKVASPPTLRRTMRYRPVAFGKLVAAVVMGLILVLGGAAFAINHMLNGDFRRLGYVDLSPEMTGADGMTLGHLQAWVMADKVRFADVRLKLTVDTSDGKVRQQELAQWPAPEQMGSMEEVAIPLGKGVRRVATCLIVPNPGLGEPYRVTQLFVLTPQSDGMRAAEAAAKLVTREDGSPCRMIP